MADVEREHQEKYRSETPTIELLKLDWDDIYAVLAEVDRQVKSNRQDIFNFLVGNPKFARALYQAQMQLGIAEQHLSSTTPTIPAHQSQYPGQMAPQVVDSEQMLQYVMHIKLSEFNSLSPTDQQQVEEIRRSYGLPPRPEM